MMMMMKKKALYINTTSNSTSTSTYNTRQGRKTPKSTTRKDGLARVVDNICSSNRGFVRGIKRLNQVKTTADQQIRKNFSGFAEESLDAFIAQQAELLLEEEEKQVVVAEENTIDSFDSRDDKRMEPQDLEAFVHEKMEVAEAMENALGASPRGMTFFEAVSSPKRGNKLQDMLQQVMWTSVHEKTFQEFKKNQRASANMASFLCCSEFREAHVEAIRRQKLTEQVILISSNQDNNRFFRRTGMVDSYKAMSTLRQYKRLLNHHNAHKYDHNNHLREDDTNTNTNEDLDLLSGQEYALAKQELAVYILRSHDQYVEKFVEKRRKYLLKRINKQKVVAEKRRERMEKIGKIQEARKQMKNEIERTRRRLEIMERKPKQLLKAKQPKSPLHERMGIGSLIVPTIDDDDDENDDDINDDDKQQDVTTTNTRADLSLLKKISNRYCNNVRTKGGGVWMEVDTVPETVKVQRQACIKIQASFRARLSRRYLYSLSWLTTSFHLDLVLKRFSDSKNMIEFRFVPQLLEDLGRVKPETGEAERIHRILSPTFDAKIKSNAFKAYFHASRIRSPTPPDMIRLVHSVKSLQHKENLLLNRRRKKKNLKKSHTIAQLIPVKQQQQQQKHDEEKEKQEEMEQDQSMKTLKRGSSNIEIPRVLIQQEHDRLEAEKAKQRAQLEKQRAEEELKQKILAHQKQQQEQQVQQQEKNHNKKMEKEPCLRMETIDAHAPPNENVKKYKQRIQVNRALAQRLQNSRQQLQVAARQLWNEKNQTFASVLKVVDGAPAPPLQINQRQRVEREIKVNLQLTDAFQEYQYELYLLEHDDDDDDEQLLTFEEFKQGISSSKNKFKNDKIRKTTMAQIHQLEPWQTQQQQNRIKKTGPKQYSKTIKMSKLDRNARKAKFKNDALKHFLNTQGNKHINKIQQQIQQ